MSNCISPIWVEVLVASPPTKKCKEIIAMFEKFAADFPDRLKIDIYYAGEPMLGTPSDGFKKDSGKTRKIPSAYINGKIVASKEVPEVEKIREIILRSLK